MSKNELAKFIAEIIMESKDAVLSAYETGDTQALRDEIYESLENCE